MDCPGLRPIPQLSQDMSFTWGAASMPLDLPVHSVGAYDATDVPTIDAFSRLDERFRLSSAVWKALPQYADYGFVIFQLSQGEARFHPMAFTFPTRDPSKTYFPTTHVHDLKVHEKAGFDHVLYSQFDDRSESEWINSDATGAQIPGLHTWWGRDRSHGIIARELPLRCRSMIGTFENADVWITS